MKNKIILIGWLGIKTAYLNISREEAIARYKQKNPHDEPEKDDLIDEFQFDDEFWVYDAWSKS